jgi:hypothetical protein
MNELAKDLKLPDEIIGLNVKETKFVVGLLCHGSIQRAGKEAGITQSTAYKWAKKDNIIDSLTELRKSLVIQSINRNKLFMNTAVDKVFAIMNDPKSSRPTQLNAAKILIELAERSIEKTDILDRMDELEQIYEEKIQK